jgi:hypothetical protein
VTQSETQKKGIFFDPSAAKGWSKVFFGLGCFDKSAAAFCNNFLVVDLLIFWLFVVSSLFSVLNLKIICDGSFALR